MSRKKQVPIKRKVRSAVDEPRYTCTLEITRGGMGFVIVPGLSKDIIIRPEQLRTGLIGDTVQVEIIKKSTNGRMEGRIASVITRKQNEFSGRLEVHEQFAFLIPSNEQMPVDIYIPIQNLNGAVHHDYVIAKIIEWKSSAKNPVGKVIKIMTNESQNEIAMQQILMEHGFPLAFSDEVLATAQSLSADIDAEEVKKRRDFRDTLCFTIDPVDAKDFDDAISFKKLSDSTWEIGVHIADVSHFVQPDTPLDKEAFARATSVYLPDRVAPMLPERISNELCSLRPNEDKYTFSAVFEIAADATVLSTWIGRTLIHSKRRFTYEEVQTQIEGTPGDLNEELLCLNTLAQQLRAERFKKGAINFSSQEVRFQLDEQAKPIGIIVKESKQAHQLIEEFMLLANKAVAEFVGKLETEKLKIPFPYRIHDAPDATKLEVFASFASRYGFKFNLNDPASIAHSFNEMLAFVKGKPEQHVLESLGIRTMSKAIYTTKNIGHYGLGFENYCHFTSPIRRYPDVLVHRIVATCLQHQYPKNADLETACKHCSDQERSAMESERSANKYKQVEYMQAYVGEVFEAVVSGASTYGFWAETVAHKCEGMVSVNELLSIDQFEYVEQDYALRGRNTGLQFRLGDKVMIKVLSANLDKRTIDFSLESIATLKK